MWVILVAIIVQPPGWKWGVWVLIGVQLVTGGVLVWEKRRERLRDDRFARGLCLQCGYDLRGRNERCPECGRAVDPRLP